MGTIGNLFSCHVEFQWRRLRKYEYWIRLRIQTVRGGTSTTRQPFTYICAGAKRRTIEM